MSAGGTNVTSPRRGRSRLGRGAAEGAALRVLLLAAVAYCGWKFIPPLKERWTIKQRLESHVHRAPRNAHRAKITNDLYADLEERGIDMDTVEIGFDYDATVSGPRTTPLFKWIEVSVDFAPQVVHVGGSVTPLEFNLVEKKIFDDDW